MLLNQTLWARLEATFKQDIPTTVELLDILQQERKALEERHYSDFQQILDSKHRLLMQLEDHAAARQQLLADAGLNDEPSTLTLAAQQAPGVANAWRKLGTQWTRCQELNEINERIARRTRLVVGQILDLLRGQQGEARLYTGQGQTRSNGAGRSITSA
jgi:flagella synthesis protein FlgN